MEKPGTFSKYPIFILLGIISLLVYRILEAVVVISTFFNVKTTNVIGLEFLGFLKDLGGFTFFAFVFWGIERLFRSKIKKMDYLYFLFLLLYLSAHGILLIYFFFEQEPLGKLLYGHTKDEVFFTITTSGFSIQKIVLLLLGIFGIAFLIYHFISKKSKVKFPLNLPVYISSALLAVYFLISVVTLDSPNFSTNKSVYFYSESISFFIEGDPLKNLQYDPEKVEDYQTYFAGNYVNNEYPFLQYPDTTNELFDYFQPFDTLPNLVFVFVEGLNDDFIHEKNGLTLMPFLSDLKDSSLYWERCFTLGERSFNVVPSVLGGLPYGKRCFMQLEEYPTFFSLTSILKENGYQTGFNYGQGAWFHNKSVFFKYEGVDYIFDKEKYPTSTRKIMVDEYFWGYEDKLLFQNALLNKDTFNRQPYMDVYFTGTMHSPFDFEEKAEYNARFVKKLESVTDDDFKKTLIKFQENYVTTTYTDDAFRQFFEDYSKRPEFENTIFIITGDHPMTEAPIINNLKRYHVPLIIYSPQLKKSAKSKNIVSHLDVNQTILNFLAPYGVKSPEYSASLGQTLSIQGEEKNRTIVFMDGARRIQDIYRNGYYLANKTLYKVEDDWSIEKVKNKEKQQELSQALDAFKYANLLSTFFDRLYPIDSYLNFYNQEQIFHQKVEEKLDTYDEFITLATIPFDSMGEYSIKVALDYITPANEASLVLQLFDQDEETAFWTNFGMIRSRVNRKHLTIRQVIETSYPNMVLKVIVWNKESERMMIQKQEVLVGKKE